MVLYREWSLLELAFPPLSENRIHRAKPVRRRTGGPIHWKAVLIAAIVAGVISTLFQLFLWWLAGDSPVTLLLRDTRLAAAILMGTAVLPPPATFDAMVMLAATIVHFSLSLAYSAVLAWMLCYTGLRGMAALVAGGLYGVAIFALNMYGFTAVFPWFMLTRDAITLAAHVVFGMSLAQAYRWAKYDGWHAGSEPDNNKGGRR